MEMLQRVYGVSFPDEQQMAAWEELQEEARARDHGTIGKVRPPSTAALLRCSVTKARNLAVLMLTFLLPSCLLFP